MTSQTLALLIVIFLGSIVSMTILAIHGLIPGLVVAGLASSGLTGAFGFATQSQTSKATVTPNSVTTTETNK